MVVPAHIKRRMRAVDPHLFLQWNRAISRWEIRRRNPLKPSLPPALVRVWCESDGSKFGRFLPLDNRIINYLNQGDLTKKFRDFDQKTWGELMNREIQAEEERMQAAMQKDYDERRRERVDKLRYVIRRGERGLASDLK